MYKWFDNNLHNTQYCGYIYEVDMKKFNFEERTFDIQLFSEGAETGGESSADAGQETAAGYDTDTDNEFSELIKGKYKDAFAKKTQTIINRRFKETKELEEYKTGAEKVLSALRGRYGTEDGDFEGLLAKVTEGSSETDKEEKTERRENPFREVLVKARREEAAKGLYSKWQSEGEELKSLYPAFDLAKEAERPEFVSMLSGGATVKSAYEALHHDEIMMDAMKYTAKTVSEAMSRSLSAKSERPFENGLSAKSGMSPSWDVNSLTDGDIAEILKQVSKGKVIRF